MAFKINTLNFYGYIMLIFKQLPNRALSFPKEDPFDRACIPTLQTNCCSKELSLQIYKQANNTKIDLTFPEWAKLAMELDGVLIHNSARDDKIC